MGKFVVGVFCRVWLSSDFYINCNVVDFDWGIVVLCIGCLWVISVVIRIGECVLCIIFCIVEVWICSENWWINSK